MHCMQPIEIGLFKIFLIAFSSLFKFSHFCGARLLCAMDGKPVTATMLSDKASIEGNSNFQLLYMYQ
jgi:hypothetical protein